jgi:hypothetical protein
VRKIISILLALGMVLGLSVFVTTPVAAQITGVTVSAYPLCVCQPAVYNVTFNLSASLTQGVGCVCVEFPAGTTFHPVDGWDDGYISISGTTAGEVDVFGAEITVTGTKVCFIPPADFEPALDNPILIQFKSDAGVTNTCTPGKYTVKVSTCRAPDLTPVESSNKITIIPCVSTYKFAWNSGLTYPGIAADFVPPFKACGQNTDGINTFGAVEFSPGKWQNAFNISLTPDVIGCLPPCVSNVSVKFELTSSPQYPAGSGLFSHVTLNFTSGPGTPYGDVLTYDATKAAALQDPGKVTLASVAIGANTTVTWNGLIHFDTVGDYTLHVYAVCPAGAAGICVPGTTATTVADRVFTFHVYQWKDAGKIILGEKWNLVSLPLVPFDTSITGLLASLPAAAKNVDGVNDLVSIWNYDGCAKTWATYGGGQTSLSTMVDGKSYWVRMTYPFLGASNYTWWVFGTERNMPPAAPSAYSVCAGWNMFGFTSLTNKTINAYLWNYPTAATQPLVYGWTNTGNWLTSTWAIKLFAANATLQSGQGYWGAFQAAGTIIP